MSAKTDFFAIISVNAGVIAQVGTRVYPDALPEKCIYPAIVFSARIVPIISISGAKLAEDIEIPCTCWAETRTAADAGADAADAALAGSKFHISGREDAYDPETGLYGTALSINA